jgi:hypothetical protein
MDFTSHMSPRAILSLSLFVFLSSCSHTFLLPPSRPASTVQLLKVHPSNPRYFTDGTGSVNLISGTYTYQWFNPSSGSVVSTGTLTAAGGNRSFTDPFAGDAILYLKKLQ